MGRPGSGRKADESGATATGSGGGGDGISGPSHEAVRRIVAENNTINRGLQRATNDLIDIRAW